MSKNLKIVHYIFVGTIYGCNDNTYKDFTYKDFSYKDLSYKDFSYKDFSYKDFTYNINKCDITYMFLFTVISIPL